MFRLFPSGTGRRRAFHYFQASHVPSDDPINQGCRLLAVTELGWHIPAAYGEAELRRNNTPHSLVSSETVLEKQQLGPPRFRSGTACCSGYRTRDRRRTQRSSSSHPPLQRDLSAGWIVHDLHRGELRKSVAQVRATGVPAEPSSQFLSRARGGGLLAAATEERVEHLALRPIECCLDRID
jgi:hypothetical protein